MRYYTIGQAARLTGRSKATISRAVKAGRLTVWESRGQSSVTGAKWVEAEELMRVFPPRRGLTGESRREQSVT